MVNKVGDFKVPYTAKGEPQATGDLQLALHDVPFLKHSQIQGGFTSNLDNGPEKDESQVRPENKND